MDEIFKTAWATCYWSLCLWPIFPKHRRLRQEDCCEFEVILGHMPSSLRTKGKEKINFKG